MTGRWRLEARVPRRQRRRVDRSGVVVMVLGVELLLLLLMVLLLLKVDLLLLLFVQGRRTEPGRGVRGRRGRR